jgi:hypothetical protein
LFTTVGRSGNDHALDVVLKMFWHHYYGEATSMVKEGTSYIIFPVTGTAVYTMEEKS